MPLAERPRVDLVETRPILPEERAKRQKAQGLFEDWLKMKFGVSLGQVLDLGAVSASRFLAEFAQYLYDTGGAQWVVTEAILAVTDKNRSWRRSMTLAWDAVIMWKELTPATSHRPLPFTLLWALVGLAAVWGWKDIALILLLGFAGMLRRGEVFSLRRRDLISGARLGAGQESLFVAIGRPKMRRMGVRRQHVKITEPFLIWFLRYGFPGWHHDGAIFGGKPAEATKALEALCRFFRVPSSDGVGITWASLRGGGATHRYQVGQPLDRILWVGRWATTRTLECYVQEHAADSFVQDLPTLARERIAFFADHARNLLVEAVTASVATDAA